MNIKLKILCQNSKIVSKTFQLSWMEPAAATVGPAVARAGLQEV